MSDNVRYEISTEKVIEGLKNHIKRSERAIEKIENEKKSINKKLFFLCNPKDYKESKFSLLISKIMVKKLFCLLDEAFRSNYEEKVETKDFVFNNSVSDNEFDKLLEVMLDESAKIISAADEIKIKTMKLMMYSVAKNYLENIQDYMENLFLEDQGWLTIHQKELQYETNLEKELENEI